jgi:poly(A) polymerase Pap1
MQTKKNLDPINTFPVQQFIQTVKSADNSRAKEVRLDINEAKRLALTLGEVMARLNGDMEAFIKEHMSNIENEPVEVQLDGGSDWK